MHSYVPRLLNQNIAETGSNGPRCEGMSVLQQEIRPRSGRGPFGLAGSVRIRSADPFQDRILHPGVKRETEREGDSRTAARTTLDGSLPSVPTAPRGVPSTPPRL